MSYRSEEEEEEDGFLGGKKVGLRLLQLVRLPRGQSLLGQQIWHDANKTHGFHKKIFSQAVPPCRGYNKVVVFCGEACC